MTATPTAVVVLALFAPPSCGPVATSAGPPLAWGAAGNALARRVPGGQGGWADPRRGHQREQGGRGWADAGRWDCVKSGFICPILFWRRPAGGARPSISHRPPPHCAHGSYVPPRAPRLPRQSAPEPGGARRCMALAGAGQAPQDGGGERAGMPWSEGSSGSRPHGWPDGRVRIRRSVGGCCGPGVPWGKDCLLPERLWTQW